MAGKDSADVALEMGAHLDEHFGGLSRCVSLETDDLTKVKETWAGFQGQVLIHWHVKMG